MDLVPIEPEDRNVIAAKRALAAIAEALPACQDVMEAWATADRAEKLAASLKAWDQPAELVWQAGEFALRFRFKAGELLGKPKEGRPGHTLPRGKVSIEPTERHRLRELVKVGLDRFEAYLAEQRTKFLANPTRGRLLSFRSALAFLTGKTERSKQVNLIKPSDNWNFGRVTTWSEKLEGEPEFAPGYIPGQLYANIMYYWTDDGDKVCAPMAGSGMIFRTYDHRDEWMGAEPWAIDIEGFDLVPRGPYADRIRLNDALTGVPAIEPDLIVADIPYFGMCRGIYSDSDEDLGNMDWGTYAAALKTFAGHCRAVQLAGQHVAIITAARFVDHETKSVRLLDEAVAEAFCWHGYALRDKAFSTRRIQQMQTPTMARMNNLARETKLMLSDMLVILVFHAQP